MKYYAHTLDRKYVGPYRNTREEAYQDAVKYNQNVKDGKNAVVSAK